MNVTVLGSGTGRGNARRSASGYWLESERGAWLLDAGDGVLNRILQEGRNLDRLDGVFLTHAHPDHSAGLWFLLQALYVKKRTRPLTVVLPPHAAQGWREAAAWHQLDLDAWPYAIEVQPWTPGRRVDAAGFRLFPVANSHLPVAEGMAQSVSVRVESDTGQAWVFTSDIADLDHLPAMLEGARLLLSECSHVDVQAVAELATRENVERLIFTHVPERELSWPTSTSTLQVDVAHDGMTLTI